MLAKLMEQIKGIIKKYHLYALKDVILFMVILVAFHVLWKIFIGDVLEVSIVTASANWLARTVYLSSEWVLNLFRVNVASFDELTIHGNLRHNVFYYPGNNGFVYVNLSCSGLKQFYQWFFLMALYPGPWRHKLWFFPMGLVIIHLVNIFRIIGMVLVTINLPEHWDFIHDNVMRPFFYVVMFALWVWWNEQFYLPGKKPKSPAEDSPK